MSAVPTIVIECDHLGCEAIVEGRTPAKAGNLVGKARSQARQVGWLVAVKAGHRFHDFCPIHRENRSFYG